MIRIKQPAVMAPVLGRPEKKPCRRGKWIANGQKVVVIALLLASTPLRPAQAGAAYYVDPFIGTAAGRQPYAKGNTFPGALVPNGMVAISPDTSPRFAGGYRSGAPFIEGFSQNHMSGVGCNGDLGNILLMPSVGPVRTTEADYRSAYKAEAAAPGFYGVVLTAPRVTAEMSATTRASISRYTFPARFGDANIIIDVSHGLTASRGGAVTIVAADEIEGYNDTGAFCGTRSPYKVYFVARFSKSSASRGTWSGTTVGAATRRTGWDIGAYVSFATQAGEAVEVRLGLSYVSIANARANLDAEIPNARTFQQVRDAALARWNADLGRIDVTGGTAEQKKIFYTALYHALIHPSVNSDVNGQYQGMKSARVRLASGYTHYHVFSLWDTYRSLHPLLSLLYPERQADMVRSMIAIYQESGWLPKWELASHETNIMVGDPAAIVIADTYLKGIRSFDVAAAYAAMKKSAVTTAGNPLRPCLDQYLAKHYVPNDSCSNKGSVSVTEEYAYADAAVGKLAKALGNDKDADIFKARSLYYRNLYDRNTGFLRPRTASGNWLTPFDPLCCALGSGKYEGPGYIEGTAWQYLFMVPHDIAGLKTLLGGDAAFTAKVNSALAAGGGHYTLINEPDMLYPYLYTFVPGQVWRTQARVRQDVTLNFNATRASLPGNDDAGQTSSRLVFDMLGFYPVDPLSQIYEIGSPTFSTATLHLDPSYYSGAYFVIDVTNNSGRNQYIRSATLNGSALITPHLSHKTITAGGTLTLGMASTASRWGR